MAEQGRISSITTFTEHSHLAQPLSTAIALSAEPSHYTTVALPAIAEEGERESMEEKTLLLFVAERETGVGDATVEDGLDLDRHR
ncbi:hypothetical protein ACFX16_008391 [Malus domestica]